ncbi:hypothetical protein AGMMS49992_12850 [Clostridia bacterium]|nr:hypothetical protein AGMMS49992_12850 [Clostridia bacterium]
MANENLPAHVATSMTEIGSITYASEVVAIIAGMAAAEIDGVAAMGTASSIADLLGRKQKPVTRGVKVEVGSEEASVDLVFTVEYGKPIQKVCRDVQEAVRKSIETMTGLHVVKVDVHVLAVSFEKETQLSQDMAQAASVALPSEPARGTTIGQVVRSRPILGKESVDPIPATAEDVDLPSAEFEPPLSVSENPEEPSESPDELAPSESEDNIDIDVEIVDVEINEEDKIPDAKIVGSHLDGSQTDDEAEAILADGTL